MVSRPLASEWIRSWLRELHLCAGLFIWLFAFTGLLLNHPQWKFAQFWASREQSVSHQDVLVPAQGNDLERARELLRQFDITGEIELVKSSPVDRRFAVRVVKPGKTIDVQADLDAGRATVEQIQINAWGVMHLLHSFTGVRMDDPEKTRDWAMTRLWSLFMDGVSVGLIAMTLSGLWMWYQHRRQRRLGLMSLALGILSCSIFTLGWMP